MEQLSLLLKYIGLSVAGTQSKRKNTGKVNYARRYLVTLLLSSLPMGIFIYYSNYEIYRNLYNSLKLFPQAQQVGMIMYLTSITMFSLFYVVGFVGTGMYAFSRSEETELLLTLPISKRILTFYNLIVSLSGQIFTIVFFLGATFGYMVGFRNSSADFILRTFLHLYFLSSISALFAVLGGGISSKNFVKKLNVIITLLLIFVYFGFMYLQDVNVEKFGQNSNIVRWLSFTNSKWNILTWSYSQDKILFGSSIAISLISTILFWYFSANVVYENTQSKFKRIKTEELMKKETYAGKLGAFLWKDLKLLLRNEQFIFLLLYPLSFGIFMMFVSNSSISSSIPFMAIAVFYCAMESGLITMNEFKYKELLLTLPAKRRTVIAPKLIVPVLLNIILFIFINVIAFLFNRFSKVSLYFLPFSVLLFSLSAIIGAYYSITKPGKAKNQPFSILATFIIEGLTIGLAMGLIYPIMILFSGNKTSEGRQILAWIIFISTLTVSFVLAYVYYAKLRKILESDQS